MAITAETFAEEMLALPNDARALLADRLVESLGPVTDEIVRALWIAEVIWRRDEVRSDSVKSIPAESVFC